MQPRAQESCIKANVCLNKRLVRDKVEKTTTKKKKIKPDIYKMAGVMEKQAEPEYIIRDKTVVEKNQRTPDDSPR